MKEKDFLEKVGENRVKVVVGEGAEWHFSEYNFCKL